MFQKRFGDGGNDLGIGRDQVIPAHTWFARNTGGNNGNIRAFGQGIIPVPTMRVE
jgi:hypothetical protein